MSFSFVENPYFCKFLETIRPSYPIASRYQLQTSVIDAEAARVDEVNRLNFNKRNFVTLLVDGWEDLMKRSLYATVIAEVGKSPVVLGLADLTGKRSTADSVFNVLIEGLRKMDINPQKVAALVTDNPTTMISVRKKFEAKYTWVLVSIHILSRLDSRVLTCLSNGQTYPCFLHLLNTLIGKIVNFREVKAIIKANTRLVTFFNRSHYWSGILIEVARKHGIKRGLHINTESRWYAMILMLLSCQSFRSVLILK